ncbi:MAG: hypothetical protein JO170_10085 [Verrucomicrobia bacterium]|nr:hypothetical protein [Verrucomicrobiota bacterium]
MSTTNWYVSSIIQLASIICGLLASVCAALSKAQPFSDWPLWTYLLIVLPLLGSGLSTFLIQSRMRQLHQLRERARIEVETLMYDARARFAAVASPEEYSTLHQELIAEIKKIETKQSEGFFGIVSHVQGAAKRKAGGLG